jgi:myosin heavy subunit
MFQAEYTEECLQWVQVNYNDNRPVVEILDGRTSVFSVLNEVGILQLHKHVAHVHEVNHTHVR